MYGDVPSKELFPSFILLCSFQESSAGRCLVVKDKSVM